MKRLLISTTLLLCSLLTFAQFSGTVSDSQGVQYTANDDDSTCYVYGHESNLSATIVIPEVYEGRSVTSIDNYAFEECRSLTSVTIPEGVTSIGRSAFIRCGLTTLTIPSSVTSIGNAAFRYCSGLTSIVVEDGNTVYDSRDNCNALIKTADNTLIAGCQNTVIPSSVTSIGDYAFYGCSGLTSVTIPEGVSWIGRAAFMACRRMTSVTIPESVTSIHLEAFAYCDGLRSVTIPDGVGIISPSLFAGSVNLSSVKLPSNCQGIGKEAFIGCYSLTSVTIPSSVTTIGWGAFQECRGMTSVMIPSSVTSIGGAAFKGCSGLTSVLIPSSVTSIGDWAFNGCSGLTSVVVEDGNTVYDSRDNCNAIIKTDENTLIAGCKNTVIPSSVTSISFDAFTDCSGLTSLTIPSSVTSIGIYAFNGCNKLESLIVGWKTPIHLDGAGLGGTSLYVPKGCKTAYENAEGWNGFKTIIEMYDTSDGAVSDSQGIQYTANDDDFTCSVSGHDETYSADIVFPEIFNGRHVTTILNSAFSGCSNLVSLTVKWKTPPAIGISSFDDSDYHNATLYVLKGCKAAYDAAEVWNGFGEIKEVFDRSDGEISDNQGVKYTANYDDSTCYVCGHESNINATIVIPKVFGGRRVTSIGNNAFQSCSGLTSLTIPSSVTSIGGKAFSGCGGLTSIIVEDGNPIYDSRDNCSAIIRTADNTLIAGCKNTVIPSSVTSIGNLAFSGCSGLTSLTIPEGVTSIGESAFYGCSGLTSVSIPEGVTSIGRRAFSGCSGLTSVTIPEGVTSIGDDTFSDCRGLTSVTIPSSVTSIGWNAFQGCSGLTSVTIPEGVTSIGDMAFYNCSGLTSLTIPSSVTSISFMAFEGCNSLTSVAVGWETPLGIDVSVFIYSNYNNATLYVPKGTKAAYESADVWKDFGSIVEKLDISDGAVSDSQGIRYTANDDESTCYVSGHDDTYSSDIIIPRTFQGRHVTSIGAGAFSGCSDLTSLTVRWGTPIAIDGSVFEGSNCHNAVLRVPIGSKAAYDVAEGWNDFGEIVEVFTEGRTSDSQGVIYFAYYEDELICRVVGHEATYSSAIIIPEFYKGSRVMSIDKSAFYNCSGLTSLTIPSSVTSIADRAFSNCNALASIIVEDGNPIYDSRDNCNAIVRTDDNMLIAGCKNTVIPTSVTAICDNAFYGCSGLTSVTIPSSVTSISDCAFCGCI